MSYSRWISSPWYTWADTSGGMGAWHHASDKRPIYTKDEVKQMILGDWSPLVDDVPDDEKAELRNYMLEFAWDEMRSWAFEHGVPEELVELGWYRPQILTDPVFKEVM